MNDTLRYLYQIEKKIKKINRQVVYVSGQTMHDMRNEL